MIQPGQAVFVDTGAWIALAVSGDPLHARARKAWHDLAAQRARLVTSVPVALETFTFLQRKGSRELALSWWNKLGEVKPLTFLECSPADLEQAMVWVARGDLHRLSLVDATSFVLMKRHRIRRAFAFDTHFAVAGFGVIG